MEINSLCELKIVYDRILEFFIDTGFGEQANLTPFPALTDFVSSYSKLGDILSFWKQNCTQ